MLGVERGGVDDRDLLLAHIHTCCHLVRILTSFQFLYTATIGFVAWPPGVV